ncbi:unnamed protein product [Brassicogethes aeneus]|uniref:Protein takeout-like n=1 Tax=Brassicogethes aeneus TaxID=1431903 RepID=A0A9P0B1C7_BRAAE|nr:unnamed protein product [Brassicogethes aeneus]
MFGVRCFCLLLLSFNLINGLHPPSYIKPCSLSDPNLNDCALKSGIEALPHLLEGDKKYGIQTLNPYYVDLIEVNQGDLKVNLKKPVTTGLEKVTLKAVKIDTETKKMSINTLFHNIVVTGNYEISGKILILPIEGQGKLNITVVNGLFTYEFTIAKEIKNGVEYAKVTNDILLMDIERVFFNFENLFNGDKILGDQINKFLNENWQDVLNEAGGAAIEVLKGACKNSLNGLFLKVPYNELFLQ